VTLMAGAGLQWIATDEDILSRSLNTPLGGRPDLLYRPYRIGAGPVALFRDHALSDRIGFAYQSWEPGAAAADFIGRIRDAGRRFTEASGGEVATVPVILDGENAWEHFEGGGRPFLRALYTALQDAPDIQTVTMSEAASGPTRPLPSIFPGSWINGDFYIWIGHRDDHRAWDQLSAARAAFDERSTLAPAADRDRALEELLIAEGSDWFWWYGDDHSSDHDAEFDDLFRRHLRNAYGALGLAVPEELFATNISTGAGPDRLEPSGFLTPTLDGRDSSFLEWVGAAPASLAKAGGAMHEVAASPIVAEVTVGWSETGLCLRMTGAELARLVGSGSATLALVIGGAEVRVLRVERPWVVAGDLVEAQIPIDRMGVPRGTDLEFAIQVRDSSDAILESIPHGRHWAIAVPAPAIRSDWQP
jgi:Glycosyl hydrolase family 57